MASSVAVCIGAGASVLAMGAGAAVGAAPITAPVAGEAPLARSIAAAALAGEKPPAGAAEVCPAIGFKGGLAMESFINMPPEVGYGLAVWRPVAENFQEVMDKGLPFLRNKAKQYRLI